MEYETCLRCPAPLISCEEMITGICAHCWTPDDDLDGPDLYADEEDENG